MSYVKNRETLLSHGNVQLRQKALEILEAGLNYADAYNIVCQVVRVEGKTLYVGNHTFDLNHYHRIYILGAGKATFPLAKALDDILGELITDGVVICKYGQEGELKHSRLYLASHPIPDNNGFEACKEMMKIARQTVSTDIVFSIGTGGSTALMPYPVDGITIEEKQKTGYALLRSGANMWEMNHVRSHLTQAKSGFLAKAIDCNAPIINFGVADGIGQEGDMCVEACSPNPSTFQDARDALTKYDLWDAVPKSVADYIRNGTPEQETPKDLSDHYIINMMLVDVNRAVEGAYRKAVEMGYDTMILSTFIEGEARELGGTLTAVGKEIKKFARPLSVPAAIITGGECTMKINISNPGMGGPSQQFALSAATHLENTGGHIVVAAIDTDGTDGPTEYAGGIVDSSSFRIAREQGLNLYSYMDAFNDSEALIKMGDAIITGGTGTNVNDLRVVLVE